MQNKIKKPMMLVAAIFGLMAFSFPATEDFYAQPTVVENFDQCTMENTTFQVGEEVVYKLYYNWGIMWVAAGEARFKVGERGGQFHYVVDGRTYRSYDWAFKVRDRIESYADKNSLLPNKAVRDIREGKYRLYEKVAFDQGTGAADYSRGKTKNTTKQEKLQISECVHDLLSAMYYARNINFEDMPRNQSVPINIFLDREEYSVHVKNKGKDPEKKIKGMGKYKTFELSLSLIAGEVFKEGDEMKIWVSDDENRLPLMIETPIAVGSVKVILKSYKGLKYPFTAKLD
jgi:hypothetical protein